MSDTGGSFNLQFWQGIAAAVGAGLAAFVVGIGRRAGGIAASRSAATEAAGDALQREILAAIKENTAEQRGLRSDWQAKRDRDEDRLRDIRERNVDEQLDDIRRELRRRRAGQDDVKILLGETLRRLPPVDPRRADDLSPRDDI